MRYLIGLLIAFLVASAVVSPAEARHRHHHHRHHHRVAALVTAPAPAIPFFGFGPFEQQPQQRLAETSRRHPRLALVARSGDTIITSNGGGGGVSEVLGGRPSGCPNRFCGCGLSLHLFGKIVPGLNLAAEWGRRFARAEPSSGMVASRSGHVFQLERHVAGDVWVVWDANSGHGKIRRHARSIRGYRIVDPNRPVRT